MQRIGQRPTADHPNRWTVKPLEHNPPLPTAWSFVPAGLMAPAAILVAVAWPKTVHPDGYVETSMWSYFFAAFHLLALVGCVRGCIAFMTQPRSQLSRRDAILPLTFLVLVIGYLAAVGVLIGWGAQAIGDGA